MKQKRDYHENIIDRKKKKMEDFQMKAQAEDTNKSVTEVETASELDLQVNLLSSSLSSRDNVFYLSLLVHMLLVPSRISY